MTTPGQLAGRPDETTRAPGQPPRRPTRRMAAAALIAALLGLLTCGTGSLVGIILGSMTLRRIRREAHGDPGTARDRRSPAGEAPHRRRLTGEGLARAGVIVGWSGIAVYTIAAVLIVALLIWAASQPDTGTSNHHWDFD